MKINLQGDIIWFRTYRKGACYSVAATRDCGSIMVGATWLSTGGNSDALLVKTNSYGEIEWQRTYGGPELDQCRVVIPLDDGGYILMGSTGSFTQ